MAAAAVVADIDIWKAPGTFTDPTTHETYNLEDDFDRLQVLEHKHDRRYEDGDRPSQIRKRWGIPSNRPSYIDRDEAVGVEYDPYLGRSVYAPISNYFSFPSSDDPLPPTSSPEELKINNTHDTDPHINTENIDHLLSQEDDDYAIHPGASNYWYEKWEVMAKHYNRLAKKEEESWNIRSREELSLDELRDINSNLGDDRLAQIHKTLESFGSFKRAPHQINFQKELIRSCLPHIYKGEWEWNQLRILKQHGIKKIDYEVFIIAPRRFGKTVTISMIVAALLLCVIGIRIIVLSTCRRASLSLSRTVKKFIELSSIHKGRERIRRNSEEELFVSAADSLGNSGDDDKDDKKKKQNKGRYESEDDLSRLYSFPGNSKGKEQNNTSHITHVLCISLSPPLPKALLACLLACANVYM